MAVNLSPVGGVAAQFFNNDGVPLAGGLIYTYAAGTSTLAATYTSANGGIAHSNPIVLDSAGRVPSGEIWLTDGVSYKFVLKDSSGILIATYDNIVGINSNFVAFTNSQEIQTATAGQTLFTLTTMQYSPGTNSLSVFVDGVNQYGPGAQYAYVETSSTSVTFVSGLHVGASVKFTTSQLNTSGSVDASEVSYTPPFTNSVTTNVEAKLSQYVTVEDFGAVGDGTTNDTTKIQNALDALTSGQTLVFDKNYKVTASLTITNKSRIRLTGKGRVFLSGASSSAYIFQLVGTLDDLEIDHLTLVGDGNSGYSQCAIGCNSGQTVSNTRFHDLNIYNINVGISHNANLGGSWTNTWTFNNYLENILGTVSGSGYGIHLAKCYNAHVYDNTINNASRHSIYIASGYNLGTNVHNNLIINHRKDVHDASIRAAIACSRVSDVTIADNIFRDCYDGQINVDHDTSTGSDCFNINIIGNTFTNRKNVVSCIWIGEQLVPTTNRTFKVSIIGNTFDEDMSTSGGLGATVYILNGAEINVHENRFRYYSVTTNIAASVELGDSRFATSDADISNISVQNNVATADASVAGSNFTYISTQLCTGTSYYWVKNNSLKNIAAEFEFQNSAPTNPNSKLKFYKDVTYTVGSLAPGVNGTYAFTVDGVKPTSNVTSKMLYSVQTAPVPVYTFGAKDDGYNAVFMTTGNINLTTTANVPSQTYRFFIEDF